jgi:hypothetical protein
MSRAPVSDGASSPAPAGQKDNDNFGEGSVEMN